MTKNYYPLRYGGTDLEKILAMQFGDENEGAALIYKREKVKEDEFLLVLNGLDPDSEYEVYDFDFPDKVTSAKGSELMTEGIVIKIPDSPEAAIVNYKMK